MPHAYRYKNSNLSGIVAFIAFLHQITNITFDVHIYFDRIIE